MGPTRTTSAERFIDPKNARLGARFAQSVRAELTPCHDWLSLIDAGQPLSGGAFHTSARGEIRANGSTRPVFMRGSLGVGRNRRLRSGVTRADSRLIRIIEVGSPAPWRGTARSRTDCPIRPFSPGVSRSGPPLLVATDSYRPALFSQLPTRPTNLSKSTRTPCASRSAASGGHEAS